MIQLFPYDTASWGMLGMHGLIIIMLVEMRIKMGIIWDDYKKKRG